MYEDPEISSNDAVVVINLAALVVLLVGVKKGVYQITSILMPEYLPVKLYTDYGNFADFLIEKVYHITKKKAVYKARLLFFISELINFMKTGQGVFSSMLIEPFGNDFSWYIQRILISANSIKPSDNLTTYKREIKYCYKQVAELGKKLLEQESLNSQNISDIKKLLTHSALVDDAVEEFNWIPEVEGCDVLMDA